MEKAPAEHDDAAPVDVAVPEPPPAPDGEEGAAATDPPGKAQPEVPPSRDRAERGAPAVLWAGMAVLAAVALVASLIAANATSARNRERQDRREVEEVAGRLATAFSTYDHRDFDATKRRVLALSTGAFAIEYEDAVGALASVIEQTKATSEATAVDVFVGNLADGKASAIVVLEIRGNGIGGPRVSVDNYVDLSLVKVEGEWRVDGIRNLNLGVAGGGTETPPLSRPATTTPAAPPAP